MKSCSANALFTGRKKSDVPWWIVRNAKEYHIDPTRLVVTGHSAGGHLALTTRMLLSKDGFDDNCAAGPGETEPHIAAIVNWYGPTDVDDLFKGQM